MNKTLLLVSVALSATLTACGNHEPVQIAPDADVTKVADFQAPSVSGGTVHFSEANTTGQLNKTTTTMSKQNALKIPEKATAICNDGTFSMALLNEACLSNGGVKQAISRYHSE